MTDNESQLLDSLNRSVTTLEADIAALNQRLSADPDTQCTAEFPHEGIRFQRGPNVYVCHCRKVYEKGPHGTLKEVA